MPGNKEIIKRLKQLIVLDFEMKNLFIRESCTFSKINELSEQYFVYFVNCV